MGGEENVFALKAIVLGMEGKTDGRTRRLRS